MSAWGAAGEASPFLPRSRQEMERRGWDALDVVLVTGDAYVDHPSFGAAIVGRALEAAGLRVGVLDVPELEADGSGWQRLPAPRLFAGVTAGTVDSMVTNYTAARHRRKRDVYRPGGAVGRPNRATIAYTAATRHHFPGVPVVVGGLEAGPRRLAHYDYWEDRLRRSILVDSKADLLVWGMGERQVVEVAGRRERSEPLSGLRGTCELARAGDLPEGARRVPSFEALSEDPELLIELFRAAREENHPEGRPLAQAHGERFVLQHPPLPPAETDHLDRVYGLPFRREVHPDHRAAGVPALEPVRWSIQTHRGCLADCSFCSIAFHQGKTIQGRSPASIRSEAEALAGRPDFRGTITDVGGPTANMYGLGCRLLEAGRPCLDRDCLVPEPCPALRLGRATEVYRRLLERVRQTPGVRHAFVGSGIRHDLLRDRRGRLLPIHRDLLEHCVSGRMKLAPEHAAESALEAMNKPAWRVYADYEAAFRAECRRTGRDQHMVEYFIVGHPGTGLDEAIELFERLLERNHSPEQVQEFIPLPMTRSCVQYVTGRDPITGEELEVPRGDRARRMQKALVRWKAPESRRLVEEALTLGGRRDLLAPWRAALERARRRRRGSPEGPELDPCG